MPRTAWTVLEVADSMRVGEQQVRDWIHSGELSAFRAGQTYRVPNSELERFYARQTEKFASGLLDA
ncbi:helix-turn-helix domain-containing protein [Actinosynnema sp. NPDC023587]|uniref:helix-turn-helix domain-containing protein n=1 Tax=Actinosynnema sp. NPDC023587 TaxID=3154695 RepID=UPI0033F2979A